MSLMRRALGRWVFTAALFTAGAGCQVIGPSGPSNVAQGRYYSAGDPDYDDFFLRVFRLQIALKDAPKRLGQPRQQLADALSVGAEPEEIRAALARRATDMNAHGIHFTVAKPSDDKQPPALVVNGNPTGRDFELKGLVEGALKGAGELKIDISAWTKELDELAQRQSTLEGNVAEAFSARSGGDRAEIKQNLADARKIIDLLVDRTGDLDKATTGLLKAIATAFGETEVASPAPPAPESAESGDKDKKGRKERRAAKPASPPPKAASAAPAPAKATPAPKTKSTPEPTKSAAAPKAAPSPKAAADPGEAPPAPKPVQGTAKPDFEP